MNIEQTIEVHAGGQGSGPNAPCPQCGPQGKSHEMEPGDFVKLKKEITVWNQKTGHNDKYPPGKVVTLVNILPKIGTADQMVSLQVHKNHDPEYFKMSDVEFHKVGNKEQVEDIKPVRPGMVLIKFKTWDGANVTWVRSKEEKEKSGKTLVEISKTPHGMKDKFNLLDKIPGKQDRPGFKRSTFVYDTTPLKPHMQQGRGAVVWVSSYSKKGAVKEVVVQEQNHTTYGVKTRGMLSFNYKNSAQAVGMLKTRYGIKVKLSELA